jgi:hypothetical protein
VKRMANIGKREARSGTPGGGILHLRRTPRTAGPQANFPAAEVTCDRRAERQVPSPVDAHHRGHPYLGVCIARSRLLRGNTSVYQCVTRGLALTCACRKEHSRPPRSDLLPLYFTNKFRAVLQRDCSAR